MFRMFTRIAHGDGASNRVAEQCDLSEMELLNELSQQFGISRTAGLLKIRTGVTLPGKVKRNDPILAFQAMTQTLEIAGAMTDCVETNQHRGIRGSVVICDGYTIDFDHSSWFPGSDGKSKVGRSRGRHGSSGRCVA